MIQERTIKQERTDARRHLLIAEKKREARRSNDLGEREEVNVSISVCSIPASLVLLQIFKTFLDQS